MMYRLLLASGHTHEGDDERDTDVLLKCINEDVDGDYDEIPEGWAWYAGLHVKRGQVIGVETVPERSGE